jgi:catechol 2,3-dioxygenase-like lactoylglutathione lyase family enzyme
MRQKISRRGFVVGAGAALAAPRLLFAQGEVPQMLDHILLGTKDLDAGIEYVERHTGMRAAFGGVHPGRGTRNALLSLGERRYLEIIAPDPLQPEAPDTYGLKSLHVPRIVTWAAHLDGIEEMARHLRAAELAFDGPIAGSRTRPDGRVLKWRTLVLQDNHHGVLPFFIEWDSDSVHPSADAPQGLRLSRFQATAPDPAVLRKMYARVGLEVLVIKGEKEELRAEIAGPHGGLVIVS